MRSPAERRPPARGERARRLAFLAAGIALAGAVQLVEQLMPLPLPWLRLGLANAVTVAFLLWRGKHAALAVTCGRYLVALLATGLSLAWLLGLAGGLAALMVMAVLATLGRGRFGPLGLSVPGAMTHMLVQFWLVAAWWRAPLVWSQLPLALSFAFAAGLVTGYAAWLLERALPAMVITGEQPGPQI